MTTLFLFSLCTVCSVLTWLGFADGIVFFESANGVLLTPGVDGVLPPRYFKAVRHRVAVESSAAAASSPKGDP